MSAVKLLDFMGKEVKRGYAPDKFSSLVTGHSCVGKLVGANTMEHLHQQQARMVLHAIIVALAVAHRCSKAASCKALAHAARGVCVKA
jgi:hypothetical protein